VRFIIYYLLLIIGSEGLKSEQAAVGISISGRMADDGRGKMDDGRFSMVRPIRPCSGQAGSPQAIEFSIDDFRFAI